MERVAAQLDRRGVRLLVEGVLLAISGLLAPCQTCVMQFEPPGIMAPTEPMPAYDVATIKPAAEGGPGIPLRAYIQGAFGMPANTMGRVIGPDWINGTRYMIQGKPPDSIRDAMQTMTNAERSRENALMQQSLLADRFQLKAHFETREMQVYDLVQAKGGSKLKEETDPKKHGISVGASSLRGSITIRNLNDVLGCAADLGGREVVDKTGLTGIYVVSLKWTPLRASTAPSGDSGTVPAGGGDEVPLFTAIEEQLGLKLVPAKESVQVLVIDHIERPSEN